MRTLFLLGIALIAFLLSNSLMISPNMQKKETQKNTIKMSEADWENLHWVIERSSVDKVQGSFEQFVKNNALGTSALKWKNFWTYTT